ncbi:MAG: hypothetical protein JO117_06230 [Verrucomicrobia bacterium]|nr:hypothetical protein [Verrucomicrobiota bacterium]
MALCLAATLGGGQIAVPGRCADAAGSPVPTARPEAPPVRTDHLVAVALARSMQKALVTIGKSVATTARGAGEGAAAANTPPRARKTAAFHIALGRCAEATDRLVEMLQPRSADREAFAALRRAGVAVAALQVTYRYSGIDDDDLDEAFRKLVATYNILRRNYGRDLVMARNEAESALNPAQRTAFDALKNRGADLARKLATFTLQIKGNPALNFECVALSRELARIETTRRDRAGLLDTLTTGEIALGRWHGSKLYVERVFPDEAKKLDAVDGAFQAFEAALAAASGTAYPEDATQVFAQPAEYSEDIGVAGVTDEELPRLLDTLRERSRAFSDLSQEAAAANAEAQTALAADGQVNTDDPDDDTSLDASDEE